MLGAESCTKQRTSDRFAPETLTCEAPSRRAKVVCRAAQVEVEVGRRMRQEQAWRCDTEEGALGEAASSWVVGATTCIETRGGMMRGDSFARC